MAALRGIAGRGTLSPPPRSNSTPPGSVPYGAQQAGNVRFGEVPQGSAAAIGSGNDDVVKLFMAMRMSGADNVRGSN